ncbi:MAG: DUF5681 domain-containing protein [Rhizomicrobium sp.]
MSNPPPDVPYAVGPGKPPLHTQFRKGQSGNPSGKPGPAKYLRKRLNVALREALEKPTQELAAARPTNALCAVARQLALDATFGRIASQRFLVELLDREVQATEPGIMREAPIDSPSAFEIPPNFRLGLSQWKELISLLQGEKQGAVSERARTMYEIFEQELAAEAAEAAAEADAKEAKRVGGTAPAVVPEPGARTVALGTPSDAKAGSRDDDIP